MEDSRTSTSSQRSEQLSTGNSRNIPVPIQELVYDSKTEAVGTFFKPLDRENELLYSSEEVHGSRKDRGPFEWLDTHVLQMTSPEDKSFFKKSRNFVRKPEEGQQTCGSSSIVHKQRSALKSPKKGQENPK
ncbi:hypothetical protein O181_014321 [Austropuccinia psidii MF-1]|uniref:Uncharacterized protein n=1 Tax=Austropuccinia psidii MF-1 TaxID=1389203 RepID=A0A9Q3C1I5_9BASI|nr:hypothetical protein [Austropuccinia psidii MF-1]